MLELKKGSKGVVYLVKDGEILSKITFKDATTKKKISIGLK